MCEHPGVGIFLLKNFITCPDNAGQRYVKITRFALCETRCNMTKLEWKWDKWQNEVLEHNGNITIRSGRQVGKSEVIGAKGCKFAMENKGTTTLIIAASQRQSGLIFEKVKANVDRLCLEQNKDLYLEKPTLTKIYLTNGSKIHCLPAGRTGHFIRGFTIDLLIADEAAYIPETVWLSVTPMIAVSKKMRGMGWIILLSTPFGKGGYFYNSFTDKDFKAWHVSSEDCKRIPKDFLKKEKQRMTKEQYNQEYRGEFTEDWHQFFPTKLIKDSMTFIEWKKNKDYKKEANYYLGVDIARYGGDENAFVIIEQLGTRLKAVKILTTDRVSTTDTTGRIKILDDEWKFAKVFIDSGGLGAAVFDQLKEAFGRRVLGLDNAKKGIISEGEEHRVKIMKEDYYSNTLMLLETKKLELISDLKLMRSMRSITFEYSAEKRLKLFGDYSHITEALIRACWCLKERGLKLYCY